MYARGNDPPASSLTSQSLGGKAQGASVCDAPVRSSRGVLIMCHFFRGSYVQRFVTKSDFQKLCEYPWEGCTLSLPNMLTVHPVRMLLDPPQTTQQYKPRAFVNQQCCFGLNVNTLTVNMLMWAQWFPYSPQCVVHQHANEHEKKKTSRWGWNRN